MLNSTTTKHTWLQKLISNGYKPYFPEVFPTIFYMFTSNGQWAICPQETIEANLAKDVKDGIGLIFPTFVARSSLDENSVAVDSLIEQVNCLLEIYTNLPIVFFLGMQWASGEEEESVIRLRSLGERIHRPGIWFVGISLPKFKKSSTLNAAFRLAGALQLKGIAWVDDDVKFGPGCLQHLVRRFFERGARGSAGARKIPQPREFQASKLLHRAKQIFKTPEYAYPHGCCMILETNLIRKGIPLRYTCEDDYFCFTLLRSDVADPLQEMEIVADALCYHTVGGPAKEIIFRIRRSVLSGVVMMADFPSDISWTFFSRILFYGFWPLGEFDTKRGIWRGILKWFLKLLYFLWNIQITTELILRGIFHRPLLEISWSGYSGYSLPDVPSVVLQNT